jgi:uncharacterized protein
MSNSARTHSEHQPPDRFERTKIMTLHNSTAAKMTPPYGFNAYPHTLSAQAEKLDHANQAEVLAFLSARPIHTVYLVGLIRDNGILSPLNRGAFYGYRNSRGELEGVALIGHAMVVEARSEAALSAFARVAQGCRSAHMILGEQETVEGFWHYYSEDGRAPRLMCRELLFEKKSPTEVCEQVSSLRLATSDDLDLIVPVHAQMAFDESGVNPLEKDAEGFRARCLRRIENGRVWVMVESGQLIFKADVVSETPSVVYLEGVYVSTEERGKGYGLRCLTQMCRTLLARVGSIGLLVNETNAPAIHLYERAGFKLQGFYDTIFLQ